MPDTLYVLNISQGRVKPYPFTHGVRYYTGSTEVHGFMPETLFGGDGIIDEEAAHWLWIALAEASEQVSVGDTGTCEDDNEEITHRWWVA